MTLVLKKRQDRNPLEHLQVVLDKLRKDQLKMHPLKRAFRVTSGKFLGFIVRYRGIEMSPSKTKAIGGIAQPRNV